MIVASIPHSGTRLVVDEILKTPWVHFKDKEKEGHIYCGHIYTYNAPLVKMRMEQYPAIVPLRHPYLTATSWKKRGMDIGEMCIAYYILVDQLDQYNPLYLPIDRPERDDYLKAISKELKRPLKTDWPMVNSRYNTVKPEDLGEDQDQVDRLVSNINPFLKRFYPRNRRGNKGTNSNKGTAKTQRTGS